MWRDKGTVYEDGEGAEEATDYRALYDKLRPQMRAIDVEILDLVLRSGCNQHDIADRLGITQPAVSHRFTRAQNNAVAISRRPPVSGVRRWLYRLLPNELAVLLWVYLRTACQSHTATIWRRRRRRRKCNQLYVRNRVLRAMRALEAMDGVGPAQVLAQLRWTMVHGYAVMTPKNTKT
jgi:DNA-binding Lrp family transcriptional regulator